MWHILFCREYEDLERSHAYLTDLVERQGIPVFGEIEIALDCTNKAIKDVCTMMLPRRCLLPLHS